MVNGICRAGRIRSVGSCALQTVGATMTVVAIAFTTILGLPTTAIATTTITVVDGIDVKDWDPAIAYGHEPYALDNVYEPLLRYNSKQHKFEPALAAEWSVTADGLKWTFRLRPNVRFHSGVRMTAQAVKEQFERSIKVGRGISHAWGKSRFEAVDESTLVITTDHPLPLDLISSSQFTFIYSPSSAARGTEWFQKGNEDGTGPYRVVNWVPNQQIVFEKYDAYWGGWKGGEPDRIIYRIVSEVSTQVQMLRSGEADLEFGTIPLNLVATLRRDPNIKVEALSSYQNMMVAVNVMKPPTDNLKFRQALTHIVDAKTVVKQIYAGFASVPQGPAPMVLPGAPVFGDMPEFDLALAKKLLDESGVPADQREITWGLYIGVDTLKNLALLYQANAAKIGIKVNIIPVEQGVFTNRSRKLETSFNIAPHQWFPDYATIDPTLLFETQKTVSFNYSYYSNADVDRWIAEGRTLEAVDKERSSEVWGKAYHKAVIDDAAAIYLADMVNIVPHRANLEGVTADTTDPAYQTVFFYKLRRKATDR